MDLDWRDWATMALLEMEDQGLFTQAGGASVVDAKAGEALEAIQRTGAEPWPALLAYVTRLESTDTGVGALYGKTDRHAVRDLVYSLELEKTRREMALEDLCRPEEDDDLAYWGDDYYFSDEC